MNDYLANSNRALILAIGMHWDNKIAEDRGETPPYSMDSFIELTHEL